MTDHHTLTGGWREAAAAWLTSWYGWMYADMPGIAAIGATAALVLTLLKIAQAIVAWLATDPTDPPRQRLQSAFGTRPAPLDD